MAELLDDIHYNGPVEYSLGRLSQVDDLFRSRSALIFTPTESIPSAHIGHGTLDVTIPIAFPTVFDLEHNPACWGPRIWLDFIQRYTGRIRWTPIPNAIVRFVRYDYTRFSETTLFGGIKSLLDSLKYKTTGRKDRFLLFYFGAIHDDDMESLARVEIEQETVENPRDAKTRILVQPSNYSTR